MKRGFLQPLAIVAVLGALAAAGLAQRGFRGGGFQRGGFGQRVPERGVDPFDEVAKPRDGEFHFIRMEYTDLPQYHRGFGYRLAHGPGLRLVDCRLARRR